MPSKIFIVEDSKIDRSIFDKVLGRDHDLVFSDGTDGPVERLAGESPDLIVLDLMLPETNGLRLMQELRARAALRRVPVFFVSASREVEARIQGLGMGAHDFLLKPFHGEELRLRVKNCLRFSPRALNAVGESLKVGLLRLDLERLTAYAEHNGGATALELGHMEFKLLSFFIRRKGEVVSRKEILSSVWGDSVHVTERTVDVHISRLRREIAKTGARIEALYGRGYRFECEAAR